jgi:predicted esterase
MKKSPKLLNLFLVLFTICFLTMGFQSYSQKQNQSEKVELFKKKLSDLSDAADHKFFVIHLESILQVINAEKSISGTETALLEKMYNAFLNDSLANPSDFDSYLNRKRTLILAWVSPTDGITSFSWLRLPKDWDEKKEYPLYVQLHGLWDVAANPISFMSFTFNENPSTTTAFEDGYFLSPWGRGNQWYHGISKTDIWESSAELEKIAKIDPKRKYLSGHSMGGYGTWHIAQESQNTWAAIGIHSGALWYNNAKYVTSEYADKLKKTPTYFLWGDEEVKLKKKNIEAHKLLENAGNSNLKIAIFKGGHDYNDIDVEHMYKWMRTFKKE